MFKTAAPRPASAASSGRWTTRQWIEKIRVAGIVAVLLVLVEAALAWIVPVDGGTQAAVDSSGGALFVVVAVLSVCVAPFVETAIMGFVLLWLQKLPLGGFGVVGLYAALWSLLYGAGTLQGWRLFPVFAVFAYVFLARGRSPTTDGFAVASLSRMFFNLLLVGLLLVERGATPGA